MVCYNSSDMVCCNKKEILGRFCGATQVTICHGGKVRVQDRNLSFEQLNFNWEGYFMAGVGYPSCGPRRGVGPAAAGWIENADEQARNNPAAQR